MEHTMKSKNILITLALMIIVAALYRVIPDRPMGFAPHWAMALFAGAVIRDKKLAFAFPIFSMFISDVIYHLLFINGLTSISGFYEGQFTNYLLFAGMTIIGFLMNKIKFKWVRGHADNPYNNRCDELATEAADGKNLLVDSGFEAID